MRGRAGGQCVSTTAQVFNPVQLLHAASSGYGDVGQREGEVGRPHPRFREAASHDSHCRLHRARLFDGSIIEPRSYHSRGGGNGGQQQADSGECRYHAGVIKSCDSILAGLNPEVQEREAQTKRISELGQQVADINNRFDGVSNDIADLKKMLAAALSGGKEQSSARNPKN